MHTPPNRSRRLAILSIISLVFSAISLYETVLRQPDLNAFAGCTWQYRRGPGSNDELFIVPVTIANLGARSGVVTSVTMTAFRDGFAKEFTGSYVVGALDDKTSEIYSRRALYTPVAVAGRESTPVTLILVQRQLTNPLLISADWQGHTYGATLKLKTSLDNSYGLIDRLLTRIAPETRFTLRLDDLNIGAVVDGEAGNVTVCDETKNLLP